MAWTDRLGRWPWLKMRVSPQDVGATAQAVRLWLALHARQGGPEFLSAAVFVEAATSSASFSGASRSTIPWTMMIACQAMEWLRRVESLTTGDIVAELF